MMKRTIKRLISALALCLAASTAWALNPNTSYTVTVSKVNANGTLTQVSSNAATTDADGKLNFTLSAMPTKDDCNFVYFTLKDGSNTVVRQGFAPAPPASDTNKLGINDLSTIQAKTFVEVGQLLGATNQADNPIPVAYMLIILRSDGVNEADIPVIGQLATTAITGTGGFQDFLTTDAGVTPTQLSDLKECLIYNADATKKTLRNFGESFYNAVQSTSTTTEKAEMQKAGGFMAEIFMDAAVCAGIDPELILAAHNAAGDAAGSGGGSGPIATLTIQNPNFMSSIDQAMSSFHQRIAGAKVATEYTNALNTLQASGTQVTTFLTAGEAMFNAYAQIESDYGDYFMDPQTYLAAHSGETEDTVRAAIDTAYSTVFSTFQTAIESSNSDIDSLKTKVASLLGVAANQLPNGFGSYSDFSGTTKNWPIPQTVMVNWLADVLTAGGQFTYTRATTPLPTFAEQWWWGECTVAAIPDQATCTSQNGEWRNNTTCVIQSDKAMCTTASGSWDARHDFSTRTPVDSYNKFMAMQEDLSILEMSRYAIYDGGAQPTREEEKQAKLAFTTAMDAIQGNIGGTTNGTIAISADQKEAIVTLLKQPSMD